jgi:hypothetical protein
MRQRLVKTEARGGGNTAEELREGHVTKAR